jgi:hypothetical protein
MATWPASVCGRAGEVRITVEATTCAQTDENLARATLKPLLQLDGIVARVEDEQGDALFLPKPS